MKTRFAPSPTGLMHFGNLRTALFNFLLATKEQGQLLLRIEDTDQTRSRSEFVDSLIQDLNNVSVVFNEGPIYQSNQTDTYIKYYKELETKKLAYPCFCSDEQLKLVRKQQLRAGFPPRYNGTCRKLSQKEIAKKLDQGFKSTLRLHMQENEEIEFTDLIKGNQKFLSKDIGDFIIRRTDGTAPFMFANAIDDSLMNVTHALRGDDHITNTPRQIYLLQILGLKIPQYGHFPLIYGMDGTPLSKRNGSAAVKELLDTGILPLALINYLARLGHYYKNNNLMSINELVANFDLKNISLSPAKHDTSHLKHWQKEALLLETPEKLWKVIKIHVENLDLIPQGKELDFVKTIQPNILMPKQAATYAKAFFAKNLEVSTEDNKILANTPEALFKFCYDKLHSNEIKDYQELVEAITAKYPLKGKQLFLPLRMIITGQRHGPDLSSIFDLMGMEAVEQRFAAYLKRTER